MSSYDITMLPLAEKDITDNVDYIYYVKSSPETALKLLDGLRKTIEKLKYMPERSEVDEDIELANREIRKCYYKNYKIFFYINRQERRVFILRVLHTLVDATPLLLNMEF